MRSPLSDKHQRLDSLRIPRNSKSKTRHYGADLPVLESALLEWYQQLATRRVTVDGAVLKAAALALFNAMPEYSDRVEEPPRFSNGWLDGFKKRHHARLPRVSPKKRVAGAAVVYSQQPVAQDPALRELGVVTLSSADWAPGRLVLPPEMAAGRCGCESDVL